VIYNPHRQESAAIASRDLSFTTFEKVKRIPRDHNSRGPMLVSLFNGVHARGRHSRRARESEMARMIKLRTNRTHYRAIRSTTIIATSRRVSREIRTTELDRTTNLRSRLFDLEISLQFASSKRLLIFQYRKKGPLNGKSPADWRNLVRRLQKKTRDSKGMKEKKRTERERIKCASRRGQ